MESGPGAEMDPESFEQPRRKIRRLGPQTAREGNLSEVLKENADLMRLLADDRQPMKFHVHTSRAPANRSMSSTWAGRIPDAGGGEIQCPPTCSTHSLAAEDRYVSSSNQTNFPDGRRPA